MNDEPDWYVYANSKRYGPVALSTLREQVKLGKLKLTVTVSKGQDGKRVKLSAALEQFNDAIAEANSDEWFIYRDSKVFGPVPLSSLAKRATSGKLQTNAIVSKGRDGKRVRLASVLVFLESQKASETEDVDQRSEGRAPARQQAEASAAQSEAQRRTDPAYVAPPDQSLTPLQQLIATSCFILFLLFGLVSVYWRELIAIVVIGAVVVASYAAAIIYVIVLKSVGERIFLVGFRAADTWLQWRGRLDPDCHRRANIKRTIPSSTPIRDVTDVEPATVESPWRAQRVLLIWGLGAASLIGACVGVIWLSSTMGPAWFQAQNPNHSASAKQDAQKQTRQPASTALQPTSTLPQTTMSIRSLTQAELAAQQIVAAAFPRGYTQFDNEIWMDVHNGANIRVRSLDVRIQITNSFGDVAFDNTVRFFVDVTSTPILDPTWHEQTTAYYTIRDRQLNESARNFQESTPHTTKRFYANVGITPPGGYRLFGEIVGGVGKSVPAEP